jgi:hypothetical protein
MSKIFQKALIKFVIVPAIIFLAFFIAYSTYYKTIQISYWDEVLWIGHSSIFESFIKRDFKNPVWQTVESFDQPKLTEYAYGAWLYPGYLKTKKSVEGEYSYVQYLVDNGFYMSSRFQDEKYLKRNVFELDTSMIGSPYDWIKRYGPMAEKLVKMILHTRVINVFFLSGAVVFGYFMALEFGGIFYAVLFTFLYGFNTLLIDTTLKAHTEGLFVLLFNGSLLFMAYYFKKGRRLSSLIAFSIMTGLCASTKLNGFMLIPVFFVVNIIITLMYGIEKKGHLFHNLYPVLISLLVFIALNPFTYSNPLNNIKYMLEWRKLISHRQANYYSIKIKPGIDIIKNILNNFYIPPESKYYNGHKLLQKTWPFVYFGSSLVFFYAFGISNLLIQFFKKNVIAIVIISSFLVSQLFMSWYLILDWPRYYVHMVYFFVFIQFVGIVYIFKLLSTTITRIFEKIRPTF